MLYRNWFAIPVMRAHVSALWPSFRDVATFRKDVSNRLYKSAAHVFVEEEFHATEFTSRRSRAAANARHARISSRVRSGKSFRISSSLIPPARYSRTSYTVIRVPLTHGLPLRTAGFIKIRSCQFMRRLYLVVGEPRFGTLRRWERSNGLRRERPAVPMPA